MHKGRILRLADIIEREGAGNFHMCDWNACIAGYCNRYMHVVVGDMDEATRIIAKHGDSGSRPATAALGLECNFARTWLFAAGAEIPPSQYCALAKNYSNHLHAAKVLRHFAETGKVDWTLTAPKPKIRRTVRAMKKNIMRSVARQAKTIRAMERDANDLAAYAQGAVRVYDTRPGE